MLLRKGSRGSEVKNLQQNLVNLNYDPKGIDCLVDELYEVAD